MLRSLLLTLSLPAALDAPGMVRVPASEFLMGDHSYSIGFRLAREVRSGTK